MSNLVGQEWAHIWYPCSQMKDYESFPMLNIKSARGSEILLENGQTVIDAISSWWCKSLGHGHPRLRAALLQQLDKFEHVILANTTHPVINRLSAKLAKLTKTLDKIFYAGDGSCAVEIAMKMSIHAHQLKGSPERTRFITLENGYHGETAGALSVSDVGKYRTPYEAMLFSPIVLTGLAYISGRNDERWSDASNAWPSIEAQLAPYAKTAAALILEPIVQGAGGMLIYSPDLLRRIRAWCTAHDVHLIADEIMTGLGRTGLPLACQHANIEPDFVCLSKGLTSGWLPLSAVCTSTKIYELFYDDYAAGKSFLHSHTYTGNALAASVALECLTVLEEENIYDKAQKLEHKLLELMQSVSHETKKLHNIRNLGGIVAADLLVPNNSRSGYEVYKEAVKLGALLRPLGNTIYWLPPLNVDHATLQRLHDITVAAIKVLRT